MEKFEYRAVIKYLFLKNKTNHEIETELKEVYGNSSPSLSTIKYWTAEFKRGRTSVFDEDRPGRPNEVTTSEMIDKIHDIVINDRRVKVREIAETVGISIERVQNILTTHLDMKKLSARWVPRLLTIDNKHARMSISKECLAMLNRNRNNFWRRFITVDETWIHHSTPETKEQSKQWVFRGESAPKKAKAVLSANKVMATVFWDARGIIHVDYLQKGKTINGEYYANLLDRFNQAVKEKRPHLAKKKSSSIRTMHVCTLASSLWQNSTNYDTNWYRIHHIRRI